MKMTVGQALVKFLDNQYVSLDGVEEKFVEGVFTIFGHGFVLGFGEALWENPGSLRVYQGRNEQGMAHAAAGFAKVNNRRKIIACASSIGPGAANMVTAVADATANNVPLLVFTGDTYATRQPDPVLQQIEQPQSATLTTSDAFRPVSRYWDRVERPEQLMSAMLNAMRVLTDPSLTGGVCISLPQDVQGEAFDFPDSFFAKRVHRIARPYPDPYELEEAVKKVASKKRPVVILGGGVRYSEAGQAVLDFCRKFGIPFTETQSGKSVLPTDDELNLGGIGVTGNLSANRMAAKADLIIGVGTKLSDFTTGSKELFRNPEAEYVFINTSRYHGEKLDGTPIVADAKVGVTLLGNELEALGYRKNGNDFTPDVKAYLDEVREARADWQAEMDRITNTHYTSDGNYTSLIKAKEPTVEEDFIRATKGLLTQTTAIGLIREHIEKDAIVVGASGSLPGDLQRMWTTTEKDSYIMEYGYSCMGYEICAAFGAKLAKPDKPSYAFVGDGAFMMLHSEIATAIQENKKITVLVFDNCGFGCINNLQMGNGIGSLATMFRYRDEKSGKTNGELIHTDFAMIGRGYGMEAYTVTNEDELVAAVEAAKQTDKCVLIDIKVLPKSMTDGYDSWWNVGLGDSEKYEGIHKAYENRMEHLKRARKY